MTETQAPSTSRAGMSGAAGLFAIVDEEGRREAAADPLAEELRLTRAAPPVGGGGSRLHAGTLPDMKGTIQAAGWAGLVRMPDVAPRQTKPGASVAHRPARRVQSEAGTR